MLAEFNRYINSNNLFNATDKILLAVSGGKDSMAMLHLFQSSKLSFGVAHCNFQLRNSEADMDEQFVREFTANHKISYHTITFNTQQYAIDNSISIQMAARDLRYEWFEKIRQENRYSYIATAHHKNDVAETMLINLVKGTGLAGLHGIKNKYKNLVRPLLCFSSAEIDNYALTNSISFREDMSNSDTKYIRNSIRHNVIPKLLEINPALIETLNNEANQFLDDEKIILSKVEEEKTRLFIEDKSTIKIKIDKLKLLDPLNSYLYYFFRDYGFNISDIANIVSGLTAQSGKTYFSSDYMIVKDREFLILSSIQNELIQKKMIKSIEDFPFKAEVVDVSEDFNINNSNNYAYLDNDKINWPLILRKWKEGDSFQPLGMNGNKKVSDFLIDEKVSVIDKKDIKVLESSGEILWLAGHRISDKYKVTNSTKKVLVLSLND